MTCSQFEACHICLTQPKLGSIVHSITYHRLICGYWQFSIYQWKNTLRLKLRHILALLH
jgi:hypothetical protein